MQPAEPQGLENRVFAEPLPGGHGHGVGDHGHDDDDYHVGNKPDGDDDGLGHGDEPQRKGLFGLGHGLGQGIPEGPVDGRGHVGRLGGIRHAYHVEAGLVRAARDGLLHGLVQIIPMEEHLGLIGGLVLAPVDAAQHELPVAGEDGPLEDDGVADLPAEPLRQLAPCHAPLAVAQRGRELVGGKDELRVELQVALHIHGEIGEEIFFIDIDAAEPVAVGDYLHPFNLADAVLVGYGKRKDKGDGVPGDQPAGGGGVDPRIPGADDRAQHAERQNGDGYAQNGEAGAEPVAEGVSPEELKKWHRSAGPFPGA